MSDDSRNPLPSDAGSLSPQEIAYLNSGNFAGAFTAAETAQAGYSGFGPSQLDALLQPGSSLFTSQDPNFNWDSQNVDAYYSALANAYTNPNVSGAINALAPTADTAVANYGGSAGGATFSGGKLGTTAADLAAAEAATRGAPNPFATDYTPTYSSGHLGGILGDVTNAAPVVGAAVGNAALVAAAAAATGGAAAGAVGAGTLGGAVAGGAAGGAAASAASSDLAGKPITLGSVGKGALVGAVGGGVSYGLAPAASSLATNTGIPAPVASGLVKAGTGALTGAVGGALSGAGAGAGALQGAEGSLLKTVSGSVLSGAGTIFQNNPSANPQISGNNQVSVDPSYFDPSQATTQPIDTGYGTYTPGADPNTAAYNGGAGTPGSTSLDTTQLSSLLGGVDPNYQVSNSYLNGTSSSGGVPGLNLNASTGSGSSANQSPLAALASLLTGSPGSANTNLLSQLLGLGATAAGGALSSSAAKGAASNYANSSEYNPYAINTSQGSTTFANGQATSNLAPGTQANVDSLNGLVGSSAAGLAGGTAGAAQSYFDNLQASQRQNNNQFYQSNLDNQFANGVLSSTAGQYQSTAALNAINQQTANDQTLANNFANTQQQNQLATLTGSLNGLNTINGGQLAQISAGNQIGGTQSSANSTAFEPTLAANSNSNIGNLLTGLGNGTSNSGTANNNALATYLSKLIGG